MYERHMGNCVCLSPFAGSANAYRMETHKTNLALVAGFKLHFDYLLATLYWYSFCSKNMVKGSERKKKHIFENNKKNKVVNGCWQTVR